MPGGDGTGPAGDGPMTGRAMGFCSGYPEGGYASAPIRGGRRGGRFGGGFRGRRFARREMFPPSATDSSFDLEARSLGRQVQAVENMIARLAQHLENLLARKEQD
jgi:hypothetical protein